MRRAPTPAPPRSRRAARKRSAAHPALNVTFDEGELVLHDRCDIGYAVQGRHGLVVPLMRDAAARSDHGSSGRRSRRLVDAGRAGTLAPEDLRGGSFTITDAGRLGGVLATPLLNTPQVAILGVHRVAERPVFVTVRSSRGRSACCRSASTTAP